MIHTKESTFNRWNVVNLWVLSMQVQTVRIPCVFGWNRGENVRIRFDSHSLWILKRFFDFQTIFFVLGLGFWIGPFELAMDSLRSGYVMILSEMRWSLSVTCVLDWRFEPFLLILVSDSFLVRWFHSFLSPSDPDPVKSFTSSPSPSPIQCLRSHLQRATFGGVFVFEL